MLLTILGPTAAVELRVVPQTYIARLKAAYKEAGIFDGDPGNIHLVFRGRELDDLRTLRDYGIGEGAVLAEVHGGDDGAEFVDYETTARLLEAARTTSGTGRGGGGRGGSAGWTRGDEWRSFPPVLVAPTGLVYEQDIAQGEGGDDGGGAFEEGFSGTGALGVPPVTITTTADGTPIAVISLPATPKDAAGAAAAGGGGGAETPRTALGLRPRSAVAGGGGGGGGGGGSAATAATLASLARVLLQQQAQQQRQRVEEAAGEVEEEEEVVEGTGGVDASALDQLVRLLGAVAGGDVASIATAVTTGVTGSGGGGASGSGGGIGAGRITYGLGSTRPAAASASGGRVAGGRYRTQAGRRVAPFTGYSAFDGRDAAAAVAADILRRRHIDDVDASGLHWHGGQPYYYGDEADEAFDEEGGGSGAAGVAEEEEGEEAAAWFTPEMATAAARAAFRRMQAEKRAAMQLVPRAPESLAAYGAYGRGGASGGLRIPLPTRSFRQLYVTQVGRFMFRLLHRLEGRWTGDAQVHVPAGAGDAAAGAPGGGPAGGRVPADLRVCTVSLTFDDTAGVWRETQSLTTRDGLVSQQRLVLQPIADGKCAVRLLEAPVTGSGAAGAGRRFTVAGHSHAGVSSRGGGPATASSGSSPAASPSSGGGHAPQPDYDMTLEEHGDRLLTLTAFSRSTGLPVLIETITLQSDMARVRTVQRFSESGVLQAVFVIQEERVIDAVTGAVMEVHATVPASTVPATSAPSGIGGGRATGASSDGAAGARSRWAAVPNGEGGYGVHRHHHHRGGLHHHHHHHAVGIHPHARRVPIAPFSGAAVTAVSPTPATAKPKATTAAASAGAARGATGTPTAAAPAADATKPAAVDGSAATPSAGSDAVTSPSPQLQHHQPAVDDSGADQGAAAATTSAPAAPKSSSAGAAPVPTGGAPGGGSDVTESAHGTATTGSAV